MKHQVFPSYAALCRAVADEIAAVVRSRPNALVCLASGHSPLGVFACLIDDVRNGRLNLSHCEWVGLDEWMGMNGADPGSCRQMMDEFLFHPLGVSPAKIHFFDGRAAHPMGEVDRIAKRIAEAGGLDVMLVGIGTNGHIAMNEPGTPFSTHTHISALAAETIEVGQKYFQSPTPLEKGITLGLADFAESRLPILMANGPKKAAIIKRLLHEDQNEQLPASILHGLNHALLMTDQEASPN